MTNNIAEQLSRLLCDCPEALKDQARLESILNSSFAAQKTENDLLIIGYRSDIASLLEFDEAERAKQSIRVQDEIQRSYGITSEQAAWIIDTWLFALSSIKSNRSGQSASFVEHLKDCFDTMVVYKDLNHGNFISSFKLPSFMRDFILKNFQDDDGEVDVDGAADFIRRFIPKKEEWKTIQNRIVNNGEAVKILAKVSVEINIANGETTFALPDYGLTSRDTTIPAEVWQKCSDALLKSEENWGVIELGYQYPYDAKTKGKIKMTDYKDFCPYDVDLEEFKDARTMFTLDEWLDVLLGAMDYNASGYGSRASKLSAIQRMLPFVEKRINLMELAPPGTGKSYFFGQISRYGWLVSGKVSRAKLIYDYGRRQDGIVALRDFVALDEIREAEYMQDEEIQSALQAIMENGKYRAADNHEVNVDAGIIFLGNIKSAAMDEYSNMFLELPKPFHQSQFLDRIHGFIKGWDLPRMNDDLKVCGWALNSEYFSSIMHELRDDPSYRAIVDARIVMPPKPDTRDTEAIKRICTAYLKLLFPHVRQASDISARDFNRYCLRPAMNMREIVRIQMGIADEREAGKTVPNFSVKDI